MITIGVSGAAGKMGRKILALASEDKAYEVKAAIESEGNKAVGQDAGEPAGVGRLGVIVTDRLAAKVDVVLDFSSPGGTMRRLGECRKLGVAIVIGTTGFSQEELEEIESAANVIPCLLSPNMSLGVNLVARLVAEAAEALGDDYDIEILEAHHRFKKDAPSGTALLLAREAAAARDLKLDEAAIYGRSGETGQRPRDVIGIHAVRGGDIVGDHSVIFAGDGERIELTHKAHSRDTFARGALRAAQFVASRPPGLYSMADVLGLK